MAKRSTIELKKYVTMLAEAGVMKKPTWLQAIEKFPPPAHHASRPGKKPREIKFEEDELVSNYYRNNPAASLEPVDLGSFDPPPARAFAYRQLELMKAEGLSRKAAKARAREEMGAGEPAGLNVGQRLIEKIQQEEGRHLDDAMATYKARMKDGTPM
jgi:hypothetical protein